MCRLFPGIPIFRGVFFIKSARRECMYGWVKNCIVTCKKKVFFDVKKGLRGILELKDS